MHPLIAELNNLRLDAEWSWKELDRACGVHWRTLYSWTQGHNPNLASLEKALSAFNRKLIIRDKAVGLEPDLTDVVRVAAGRRRTFGRRVL